MELALPLSGALLVLGASWFAVLVARPGGERLGGLLDRYVAFVEAEVELDSTSVRAPGLLRLQVVAAAASLVLSITATPVVFVPAALAAAFLPPFVLRHRHRQRVERIEQQLDGWLLMLSNALRATPSVGDAIASTATLTTGELGRELDRLSKELKLGVPVDRTLRNLSERVGSDVVTAATTTIVVARRTGGDLSSALERSAASLREAARLEGVLRTKTAEGRGQVLVLAGAPFVLCSVIVWLEPTWFDSTFEHSLGGLLFAGCGVLWVGAAAWAHVIVERASS